MKSFFVIKGEPNQWFDQQGEPIPLIDDTDMIDVRHLVPFPQDAVGCDYKIYDPREVKHISIQYHVVECNNKEEVDYLAKKQNEVYELDR